jgi:hypothetical protein
MNWFANCNNLEELKRTYKDLVMKHHPDRGGDNATMAQINAQYDKEFERLQKMTNNKTEQAEKVHEYRDLINKLLNLNGIIIEICGAWLWISGNTKPHKDTLKELKCMWSPKKVMWYWRPENAACRWSRGHGQDMDTIRAKYGSTVLKAQDPNKIEKKPA